MKITANRLSYALVYIVKKSHWKTGILLKMYIYSETDTFDTSKPGNCNSLRGHFYYETVTLKLNEEESQCQNKVLRLFFTSFI